MVELDKLIEDYDNIWIFSIIFIDDILERHKFGPDLNVIVHGLQKSQFPGLLPPNLGKDRYFSLLIHSHFFDQILKDALVLNPHQSVEISISHQNI